MFKGNYIEHKQWGNCQCGYPPEPPGLAITIIINVHVLVHICTYFVSLFSLNVRLSACLLVCRSFCVCGAFPVCHKLLFSVFCPWLLVSLSLVLDSNGLSISVSVCLLEILLNVCVSCCVAAGFSSLFCFFAFSCWLSGFLTTIRRDFFSFTYMYLWYILSFYIERYA